MPYLDPAALARYKRAHYDANAAAYKARAVVSKAKTRKAAQAFILAYLAEHPCIDCEEPDPVVLEFDHRNPDDKCFSIACAVNGSYTVDRLRVEIAKCDVRCANCHRRRTGKQFGWFKSLTTSEAS